MREVKYPEWLANVVVVGYIKVQQLYRVLSPSPHVFLSFCVEYVLLTFSTVFMRVQVVRCPMHIFVAVWFHRTTADYRCHFQTLSGGPEQF